MDEHTCDECGATFYYAPKYHECRDAAELERDRAAFLSRSGRYRETWAEECRRKVMG